MNADHAWRIDAAGRARLRASWHGSTWALADGAPLLLAAGWWAISAWNPWSRRLPEAVNRARDAVLLGELRAGGAEPLRVRGGGGGWWEDGWAVALAPAAGGGLLRRYGQWAALVQDERRRVLRWFDGATDAWDDVAAADASMPA